MKKHLLMLLTVGSYFLFTSCEEEIFIKADFKQKYILNCIINGNDSTQIVSIMKTFDVDGVDPSGYDGNNFVSGAYVRIWYRDTVYVLKDTLIEGTDPRGNNILKNLYYTNVLKPDFGKLVEIEALLPDGHRLKSSTRIPERVIFPLASVTEEDPRRQLPGVYADKFTVFWTSENNTQFFRPKYTISFDRYFGFDPTRKYFEVPVEYVEQNGNDFPVYAGVSGEKGGYFSLNALKKAMTKLSDGYPVKNEFRIFLLNVELTIMDQPLAAYYSATGNFNDQFSISLDRIDYTNVEGGLGIFGSKIKQNFAMYLEPGYIRNFGYNSFFD